MNPIALASRHPDIASVRDHLLTFPAPARAMLSDMRSQSFPFLQTTVRASGTNLLFSVSMAALVATAARLSYQPHPLTWHLIDFLSRMENEIHLLYAYCIDIQSTIMGHY